MSDTTKHAHTLGSEVMSAVSPKPTVPKQWFHMTSRSLTLEMEDSCLITDGERTVILVINSNDGSLQLYGGST